jgi:hypothetical protein
MRGCGAGIGIVGRACMHRREVNLLRGMLGLPPVLLNQGG